MNSLRVVRQIARVQVRKNSGMRDVFEKPDHIIGHRNK
jgi:hypothetical protein